MRVVTIVSLAASAVLGLGALFVAKIALPSAASAKNPAARAEAAGEPLVVASRAIKYGEKLDAGMLTVIKAPKSAIPEGSFTTVAQALAADHGGAPVVLAPRRPGDLGEVVADCTKIRATLDWTPERADLDLIVRDTVRWYESRTNAAPSR
mgnify:CR=1 FL=1